MANLGFWLFQFHFLLLSNEKFFLKSGKFRLTDFQRFQEGLSDIVAEFDCRKHSLCPEFDHGLRCLQPFIFRTFICGHTVSGDKMEN